MEGKREEQMKEITERLEQGLQELFTSEKYTEYLKTMSQFHNYSFNNTLLIAMQKPEATLVAGYGSWQKKFNRQVKRGEKGIRIIAPAPVKRKEEVEKFDPETNEPILRPDGQPETEEVEHIIPRFRVATVFDISQTDGDPLPELDTPELMGDVENFPIFMEAIGLVSPAPIRYAEIEGEAKGYYSNADKEIVIQEGMSEKQAMKTAVHEVTHAMCHDRDLMEEAGEKKNQVTREVEAESVAYTVCSYFGLDTSDYSFPYIAGWSSSMDMKELRSSMNFIRKTAGSFIDGMVENIQKLQKEKETKRELGEDDLVFQVALPHEDAKRFYLVDNVGRVDFLRLLQTFADQRGENESPEQFLKDHGVHLDLWKDSENPEKNENMPDFYDVLYIDAEHIIDASKSPTLIQVEFLISRAEYGHTALGREEHNLAVRHAYKLDNLRETQKLIVELVNVAENPGTGNIQEIMDKAQAKIDALPDHKIGILQMHEFGYRNDSVMPLTMERAVMLHHAGLPIYNLHEDGSSTLMNTELDILEAGGMFGVDAGAWENYLAIESVRGEETAEYPEEQKYVNEDLFFKDNQNRFAIYQIKDDSKGREYLFMGTDFLKQEGLSAEYTDYEMVYTDVLMENDTLDSLYEKFNISRPEGFKGHSLSASDVVALKKEGEVTAYYVDSFGYTELPEFISQREKSMKQGKEAVQGLEKETYPPLYLHTFSYAMEHGRTDDYRESRKINLDCKKAVEAAIRENFDGLHLAYDAAEAVLEKYGAERVTFVLANTVQQLDYDGRFSRDNKEWAEGFEIPENINHGRDMNTDCIVTSHPAVLDGFIGLARDTIREQGLQQETEVQINGETRGYTADGHFGTWHTAEVREINGEPFYRMEHDTYDGSVASIIVIQEGKLVAEDLEHGFDQGAMEAIHEYFVAQEKIQMAVSPVPQQAGPEESISFYVAECMEFPSLGEYHEHLETLQEAMELYEKIPEERMNGVKGIGFRLENGSIYDGNFDLMAAGELQTEFINDIVAYRNSPLVQKAIADMEAILSGQMGQDKIGPEKQAELTQQPVPRHSGEKNKNIQTQEIGKINAAIYKTDREDVHAEPQAPEPGKSAETALKADKSVVGGSRKQSVLNALRERQVRLKAQQKERQGQKSQAHKKGRQEL